MKLVSVIFDHTVDVDPDDINSSPATGGVTDTSTNRSLFADTTFPPLPPTIVLLVNVWTSVVPSTSPVGATFTKFTVDAPSPIRNLPTVNDDVPVPPWGTFIIPLKLLSSIPDHDAFVASLATIT